MLSPPVVVTDAPAARRKSPETVLRPVSALLVVSLPASAITRVGAVQSQRTPSIVPIWPLANSSSAVGESNRPGRHPRRAEPGRPGGDVQRRLDGAVPLRSGSLPVLTRAVRGHRVAGVIRCCRCRSALLLVLLLVSVPPTVRLLPPPPLLNGESTRTIATAGDAQSAGGGDRRSVCQTEIPGDRVEAGQRAVGCQLAGIGDQRVGAVQSNERQRSCRSGRWRTPAASW